MLKIFNTEKETVSKKVFPAILFVIEKTGFNPKVLSRENEDTMIAGSD